MPTYEYTCKLCGEHLEAVQSFHDAPLTSCPSCGGELRKVFGNVGIVFKGSGFYKTDSRSSGSSRSAGEKAGAETIGSTEKADKAEKTEKTEKKQPAESASSGNGSASKGGSSSGAAPAVASTS